MIFHTFVAFSKVNDDNNRNEWFHNFSLVRASGTYWISGIWRI